MTLADYLMQYTTAGVNKRLTEWHQRKTLSTSAHSSYEMMQKNLDNPNNVHLRKKCFIPAGGSNTPFITMECCQNALIFALANLEMNGIELVPGTPNHDLSSRALVKFLIEWDPMMTDGSPKSRNFELKAIIASVSAIASCMWSNSMHTSIMQSLGHKEFIPINYASITKYALEILRGNIHFSTVPNEGGLLFPFLNERTKKIGAH